MTKNKNIASCKKLWVTITFMRVSPVKENPPVQHPTPAVPTFQNTLLAPQWSVKMSPLIQISLTKMSQIIQKPREFWRYSRNSFLCFFLLFTLLTLCFLEYCKSTHHLAQKLLLVGLWKPLKKTLIFLDMDIKCIVFKPLTCTTKIWSRYKFYNIYKQNPVA